MGMRDDDGTLTAKLAVNKLWIPATDFVATAAGPTLEVVDVIHHGFLLDSSAVESIACAFIAPSGWSQVDITYYGYNASSGTGGVCLGYYLEDNADGSSLVSETPTAVSDVVFTAAGEDIMDVIAGDTGVAVLAGGYNAFKLSRLVADAGDTLANDWGLLGVCFTRAG